LLWWRAREVKTAWTTERQVRSGACMHAARCCICMAWLALSAGTQMEVRRRCGAPHQLVEARRPTNSFHACMHRSSRGRCRLKVSAGASHAPQQIMLCAYSLACVASSMQACSYRAPRSISTTIIINSLPCCMDTYMYLYATVVLYICIRIRIYIYIHVPRVRTCIMYVYMD